MEYYSQYKFNFYLNATHAIYFKGNCGTPHPHTWEITIHTIKLRQEFVQFHDVEETIEALLEKYQNKFLNDFEPFDVINPTLEYITQFLLEQFQEVLKPIGWLIFMIEISETPTRSYVISTVENNYCIQLKKINQVKSTIEEAFREEQ